MQLAELYEPALILHGHKCPAMPMGLRVGMAALEALGVDRAADGQLMALIDIGKDHCATCFADGVQMATGCTLGKGNIQKLDYGKWGLTLIDKKNQKAVRVAPKAEAMMANKKTEFFQEYRMKGIPASQVPQEVVQPLVDKVMGAPVEAMFDVSEVFDQAWHDDPHSFDSIVCDACGEMVVEPYARVLGDKRVCIPCEQKLRYSD